MITNVDGDLIKLAKEGQFDIIIHGCNCQTIMGAGIAKQIKDAFPEVYEADVAADACYEGRRGSKLGTCSYAICNISPSPFHDKPLIVVNLYQQIHPGRDLYLRALEEGLRHVAALAAGKRIGMPKIGAGIAGGNWNDILKVIINEMGHLDVTIVHYQPE